jgi:chromosome segregation ATPase
MTEATREHPSALTGAGVLQLALSYLRRPAPVSALDWLPLAEAALAEPHHWAEAFGALRVDQQYDLTELLRADEAGPLAETLLMALSLHASDITDEQVRADVLADAQVAAERREARLTALRERAAALAGAAGRGEDRLREGFDVAAEMAGLEARLAALRAQAHGRDGDFARMYELEHAILREETRMGVLARYDEAERRRTLAALRAQAGALAEHRSALEEEIVGAQAERDTLQHRVQELSARAAEVGAERDALRGQADDLEGAVPRLHAEAEELRGRVTRLRQEKRAVDADIASLGEHGRKAAATLAAERARLRELADAARTAGMGEIERRIQELFQLLPADAADQAL